MRCEQAFVRVCDGLREDGEVDWQIARAARVKIVRNSASMNRGLGGRGGRRTARSAAFMAHLNRPGLKKCGFAAMLRVDSNALLLPLAARPKRV